MNLYSFHTDPKSLKHHDIAQTSVPKLVWKSAASSDLTHRQYLENLKSKEHIWVRDPYTAYHYARVAGKPFPAGEKAIAQDSDYAYRYADRILKKRFPIGEETILQSNYAYDYAVSVIKNRWPEAEKKWLKQYANNDDRAPDMLMMNDYIKSYFPEKRWPELEHALIKSKAADRLYAYASVILKRPFPEAEPVIATNARASLNYAQYVLHGPFPAGEKAIRTNSTLSAQYDAVMKYAVAVKKALTNQYGDED